jgi:5-methylcytosine-specific restriction endonuclease McrA
MSERKYLKVCSIHKEIDGVDYKQCKKCEGFKTADPSQFYRWKGSLDGLADWCKNCRQAHDYNTKDLISARLKDWYRNKGGKALVAERHKIWKSKNRVRHLELSRQYANRRRARMYSVLETLTTQEWLDRLAEYNYHCAYCLKPFEKLEIEHMHPISRGGEHTLENVVPACRSCNGRKHSMNLLEFAQVILNEPIQPQDILYQTSLQ